MAGKQIRSERLPTCARQEVLRGFT